LVLRSAKETLRQVFIERLGAAQSRSLPFAVAKFSVRDWLFREAKLPSERCPRVLILPQNEFTRRTCLSFYNPLNIEPPNL
jgi:hypothetical protein